ncbi:small conductance mechanosensitive channel [Wenyingzhuangia heitensis]|uniref:Small conductance mechanosensitive channel n=1 Tax=Wenyingzhuangia heitensis TaxID=1487859 RepID=A0ABX0UCG4_9FLAO|nr:mechanosensitive ion channel family protein [Wenyingzhuangia heitensis]NIJ45161.1 small conductance mechanosensitive channel [Wenyingzhuangia heitensis]
MEYFNINKSYEIVKEKLVGWAEAIIAMLPNIVLCIVLLIGFYFLARLVRMLTEKGTKKITNNQALTKLIGTISFIVFMSLGFFVALSVLKLDKAVTSLLAGAGVIGLALSFAFQDSATNFISGVFMAVRKPFRIGDVIETADEMGVVQHINLRNIVMHSFNGQEVIIPNKDVFQNKIRNYTSLPNRRVEINCGVAYSSDLVHVKEIGEKAISALDFVSKSKDVNVFFNEYGGSAINFTLYFWIDSNDQPGFLKARNDAIIALKQAFDKNDIGIPFPIRTLDFDLQKIKELITNSNNQ